MKKTVLCLMLTGFISINLIGCSKETSIPVPASPPLSLEEEETVGEEEINPEVLLAALRNHLPLEPLGDIPIPVDNLMTKKKAELGQALFFDPRLSGNNKVSCATCHDPNKGYGDGERTFETYNGSHGKRNSPTVLNSGYYTTNFWDGRASSLEEQALGPIENPNEMNQKIDSLVKELKAIKGYEKLFSEVFPNGITEQNIAKAIAAFERLIVVKDTPFDQFLQGDTNALTQQELRGLDLFTGKALCVTCHNGPNLSDNNFYNVGLNTEDEGRFAVTGDGKDLGRIRTPGLYGITHTAPYMHNGSIATLVEVIEYYDRGGDDHPNKSFFMQQFMKPIGLSDSEKEELLAFLKVLGGEPPYFAKPELPR
jgi:cytochrome c peroxidase